MADQTVLRQAPLSGMATITHADVTLARAEPACRILLRLAPEDAARLGSAAGFDLSGPINSVTGSATRFASRLGPDEWLLLAPLPEEDSLPEAVGAALAGVFHSAVDVSHRNTGLMMSGPALADMLNAGCPLDLSEAAFPPGMASRTILGKAEIVLIRCADGSPWRIEVWRSFAPYVWGFLNEAAR